MGTLPLVNYAHREEDCPESSQMDSVNSLVILLLKTTAKELLKLIQLLHDFVNCVGLLFNEPSQFTLRC
jgi:hypothetical protein